MLGELEWSSLEPRRVLSSLLLFHKIHTGSVSIEKDKYLTPAHSLKSTRASHSAQYCRYQTYSDALKNSPPPPPPELFHSGMVFLLRWSIPRLLGSLGHSSFSQNTAERFFLGFFLGFFFFFFFVLFFLQNSKFALPGVMIAYDRASRKIFLYSVSGLVALSSLM